MSPILTTALALLAATTVYILLHVGHRARHLPPGPRTLPILGNITHIPRKGAHFQLTRWARLYGGCYSLKLGTGTAVVLTDRRLIKELLDRRSGSSSARPRSFVARLIAAGDHILLMDYGARWRDTRKLLHGAFAARVVEERCLPLQEAEARQMLCDYLAAPQDHMLHPKRFSNSLAMSLVWGVRTPTPRTEHMERLYSLMEIWSKVIETGATPPVDIYPFLHWLPQSVFFNWLDRATHVQKEMNHLYSDFLRDLRMRRKAGGSRGSLMDRVLDEAEAEQKRSRNLTYSDHELWFLGGTVTEGASDTTASVITAFVQAMVAYPHIQKKAQAEIDAVIGEDRSPTWQDYKDLPYVAQCVKETMRWRPVTPLGVPHALDKDEWLDGMLLPKDTTVIINAWGLHFDPDRFENPEKFDPDHFKGCTTLAPDLANGPWEDRDHYGYGVGRRFCPGAHLAERNLFVAMSKLLWAFSILPPTDENGRAVMPDVDPVTGYSEGLLVCVNDFEADFKVRGERRRETILREFEATKREFDNFQPTGEETA